MNAPWYSGLFGFRDVGGIRTHDGRVVRRGLLFRSGTPQFLELGTARMLLADTGIRSTIDLRLPHEAAAEGRGPLDRLGVRHRTHPFIIRARVSKESAVAPMPGDDPLVSTYLGYLQQDSAAVVSVVSTLLEPDTLPTLVHCTVGKDRTGVTVALTLAAAGVHADAVVADYARTEALLPAHRNRRVVERLRALHPEAVHLEDLATRSPAPVMRALLDDVAGRYGSAADYLRAHGLADDELAELRRVLLRET